MFYRNGIRWTVLLLALGTRSPHCSAEAPSLLRHVVVYGEPGKFGGWPANHGMWVWGQELLVGFSTGIHKNLGEQSHNIDRDQPEHHVLARSRDGGETWVLEHPAEKGMLINAGGMRHGITDPRHVEPAPVPLSTPLDFQHPDFCMTMRFQNVHAGTSRLYYSYDRGTDGTGRSLCLISSSRESWLGPTT